MQDMSECSIQKKALNGYEQGAGWVTDWYQKALHSCALGLKGCQKANLH
jgi:hypothetical protein